MKFNNMRDDNFTYNDGVDININNTNTNNNMNINNNANMQNEEFNGGMQEVIEAGTERVVRRDIFHEVKHICPINTRIINNHIYRHTYQPCYSCCEENVITNQQCDNCGNCK